MGLEELIDAEMFGGGKMDANNCTVVLTASITAKWRYCILASQLHSSPLWVVFSFQHIHIEFSSNS
jgi:hypothetical protein